MATQKLPTSEPAEHDLPVWITGDQLSERYQISRRTFDRMVATGKFPKGNRLSQNTIRWPRDVVLAHEESQKQ